MKFSTINPRDEGVFEVRPRIHPAARESSYSSGELREMLSRSRDPVRLDSSRFRRRQRLCRLHSAGAWNLSKVQV